jgi:hypothetical protein
MFTIHQLTRSSRALAGLTMLALVSTAHAGGGSTTLTPANSIQAAINSGNFSEIVLSPGTYFQTIVISAANAPLTLRSQNPSDAGNVAATVIDGEFLGTSVILINGGGADIVIDGLTIQNGEALGATGPANRGGAIDCEAASPTIRRCVFANNHADSAGGAFYVNAGNMTIEDCTFAGNDAPFGGGAYCNNSTVNFKRCAFDSNIAATEGGACRMVTGTYTFDQCEFVGNDAVTFGGAIATRSGALLTVRQCWFESNFCGDGGTNGRGGAIFHEGNSASFIDNSVFWNNSVSRFGASVYSSQTITVRNSTHYGDVADGGGAVTFSVGNLNLHNSIIWNPSSGSVIAGTTLNITYCNIQGGFAGAGNMGADSGDAPDFADSRNGDFRLLPGSAGIDSGDATKVVSQYPTDFDGNPRALNDPDTADTGVAVLGISVDMGAFEFQPEFIGGPNTCPADVVSSITFAPPPDGVVDAADLAYLLGAWGACE